MARPPTPPAPSRRPSGPGRPPRSLAASWTARKTTRPATTPGVPGGGSRATPEMPPEVAEVFTRWKGDDRITPALALDVASYVARAVRDGAEGRGRPVEKPAGYLVANMRKQLEKATAYPVKLPMYVPDGPRQSEAEYMEECRIKAQWRRKRSKTKEQQRRERAPRSSGPRPATARRPRPSRGTKWPAVLRPTRALRRAVAAPEPDALAERKRLLEAAAARNGVRTVPGASEEPADPNGPMSVLRELWKGRGSAPLEVVEWVQAVRAKDDFSDDMIAQALRNAAPKLMGDSVKSPAAYLWSTIKSVREKSRPVDTRERDAPWKLIVRDWHGFDLSLFVADAIEGLEVSRRRRAEALPHEDKRRLLDAILKYDFDTVEQLIGPPVPGEGRSEPERPNLRDVTPYFWCTYGMREREPRTDEEYREECRRRMERFREQSKTKAQRMAERRAAIRRPEAI